MPLHPQSIAFIQQLAQQDSPPWHEMPVAESRQLFSSLTGIFGEGPELFRVEDGDVGAVPVRIYRPVDAANLPVLVFFHGGGWVLGDLDSHDALCRQVSKASGFVVVAVDYRLAPEHKYPSALDDCYSVTAYVAQHAEELGVDAARLVLAGDSAGGNLAAAVSLRAKDQDGPPIRSQVLMYPVVEPDFETESYTAFATDHGLTQKTMQWFWQQYVDDISGDVAYADLAKAALSGSPPTHLITAEYDVLRDEGERFARRLQDAGVSTTWKRYQGMLHGFIHFGGIFDDGISAVRDIGEILKEAVTQRSTLPRPAQQYRIGDAMRPTAIVSKK